MIVSKDLYESSQAGLFTSNNTNKAEVCCLDYLFYPVCETPQKTPKDLPVRIDSQIAWNMWTVTLWLVHFAERTGGRLATFTAVNLKANISYGLITVVLLYLFSFLLCNCVSPWHSDALFATLGRRHKGKSTDVGELIHCSASTVWEPVRNVSDFLTAARERMIGSRSPPYTAQLTAPNEAEIWPDAKMRCAAQ